MVKERIEKLRSLMKNHNIDAYLVPTNDFHGSEYVGEYFKCREYITGFTGSAGTALITMNEAKLWTDGRYFIQAARELDGTGIELMKSGEENVPNIEDYLGDILVSGKRLGFDGRCIDYSYANKLEEKLAKKNVRIVYDLDLVGDIWNDRPKLSCEKAFILDIKYCGKSREDKLLDIREKMKEKQADIYVLTSLDDIAWLFNIRGNDIKCNPVVLSYAVVTMDNAFIYGADEAFSEDIRAELENSNIYIKSYNDIYEDIKNISMIVSGLSEVDFLYHDTVLSDDAVLSDETALSSDLVSANCSFLREDSSLLTKRVYIDCSKANYAIVKSIPENVQIIDDKNLTLLPKSIKNQTEIENLYKAHIKDGVAVTKFMYWLKKNVGRMEITEISAAEYLEGLRSQGENYMGPSFEPIVAYGANAAMCHYSATAESNARLLPQGLVLFDTGGQYFEGTTDITRTIALGPCSDEEKKHYTAVLRGHLALAAANFPYGVRGVNLDCIARGPLWEMGLNYNHGTGHGVGYFLNVHEGPNSFRWKILDGKTDSAVLEEGMVTSNEPGFYEEGKYGIRTENLIVCVKAQKTEYGQFMEFKNLTMVPMDIEAIDMSMMTDVDRMRLNNYHRDVYEKISPYLNEDEKEWLKEATKEV